MTIEVGYRYVSSQIVVGYWDGSSAAPAISGTPTVTDGSAITINGVNFSGSGNRVFVGNTELTVNTESSTQIVTVAQTFTREPMTRAVELYVINASDVESAHVSVTIQPASGQRVFSVTQSFLGDASTRLEGDPDLSIDDEIIIRSVTGTNVTASNVNVATNATTDVVSDTDDDPNVASFEYAIFDGDQRSATWAAVTWDAAIAQTTVPNVVGLSQSAAESAATAALMTATVIVSVYSSSVAAGLVITQYPAAAASVNEGTILELTLSLGIAPTLVPDLAGLNSSQAATACTNAGVTLGTVRRYIDGNNSGLVVNQSITPGTAVDPGTTVDIALSSNLVPNVVGLDYPEAIGTLLAANLSVDGSPLYVYSTLYGEGEVSAQSPAADAAASANDTILLTVSLGAQFSGALSESLYGSRRSRRYLGDRP